ncbi:hypothetical protein ACIQZB_43605 [Streptomyces sp. NPDC097727]|uniref:DUF7739 domain-containing protein n=1 Tax=Streptomyces sp. NPDC097727 TaxID=3366092 RepID=UPI0037F55296
MSVHIVTSHGADFFGEDRYEIRDLQALAGYAEGTLPHADRQVLVRILAHAGSGDQEVPADQAAEMAGLFRRVAAHGFTRTKPAAHAMLLAAAAARAASDGEPWTWTLTTTKEAN